jgi:segregation and condensation protein B
MSQIERVNSFTKELTTNANQYIYQHLKKVLEALFFSSSDPLSLAKIREVTDSILPLSPKQLISFIQELKEEYIIQQRAFQLEEIADGYVLRTHEEYAPYIEKLFKQRRSEKLSAASTEVLAIIAYKQPITRSQIDSIRGVDSSGIVSQLMERQLIEANGKAHLPGRPTLYRTTKEFLHHFGLKSISELQNNSPYVM